MTAPDVEPTPDGPEVPPAGRAEELRPPTSPAPEPSPNEPDGDDLGDKGLGDEERMDAEGARGFADAGRLFNLGQSATGDHATSIGSINITYGSQGETRCWSGMVTAEYVARLSDTYVPAPSDLELDRRLATQEVVFLGAPAGTGRGLAAHLAQSRRHAVDKVALVVLAPGTPITALLDRPDLLWEGCGHVLEPDLRPDPAALAALELRARSRRATVVVIGDTRRDRDLADYLVEHRLPDLRAVFRAHLVHGLGERGTCVGDCVDCRGECLDPYADRCLRHPDLAAELDAAMQVSEAIDLARPIAAEAPKGDELDALLADLLPARLRRNAELILRATVDPDVGQPSAEYRRAFRIAYAVFDGLPLTWVFEAADRLVDPDAEDGPGPSFGLETRVLVGDGMCAPEAEADESPRLARMRSRLLVRAMLDVAWNDWGLARHLLRWLDALVESGRPGVRERAAVVAGWLARYDFAHVYDSLVDLWARSQKGSLRGAAALAARTTAEDHRLQPLLGERIRDWLGDGSAYQRASVARAYYYGLGRVRPFQALADLRVVARDRMQRRNEVIAAAVDQTYPSLDPGALIRTLRGWAEAEDELVRVHASRALVLLAARPAGEPRPGWPELLARAADRDVAIADLAGLWAAALVHPATAFEAWRRLGYWIGRADGRPQLADWLAALLVNLADGPLRDRLVHHLAHVWRRQMPQNPFLVRLTALLEGDPT
jgi:hypothetical protein